MKEYFLKNKVLLFFILLIVVSVALHFEIFNLNLQGIHLWRQAQTQNNITNFYRQDFNILNPREMQLGGGDNIQRMEFPLMQWFIASQYKLFGESLFITRLWMFIISISGVVGFFKLIQLIFKDNNTAFFTAWAFAFAPTYFYYSMNPLPDLLALSLTIWYLYFAVRFAKYFNYTDYLLSGFFLSVAMAVKLPYIIFGSFYLGFIPYYILNKRYKDLKLNFRFFSKASLFILFLIPPFIWYIIAIPTWATGITTGIFENQISFKNAINIFNYHLNYWLPQEYVGPLLIPFLAVGFVIVFTNKLFSRLAGLSMIMVFLTVLSYFIFEINMISYVHDYYMFPFLIPFFVLIGLGINYMIKNKLRYVCLLILMALPVHTFYFKSPSYYIMNSPEEKVIINNMNELRSIVPKEEKCILFEDQSHHVFAYLVDKQGYIFANDHLPISWIDDMVNNYNVKYMYSNNNGLNQNKDLKPYIDSLLFDKDGLKVIKLKKGNLSQ